MSDNGVLISEFMVMGGLTKITDEAYKIVCKSQNEALITLYHIANAGMKIIEDHNLWDEFSKLLNPVLEKQKEMLEGS